MTTPTPTSPVFTLSPELIAWAVRTRASIGVAFAELCRRYSELVTQARRERIAEAYARRHEFAARDALRATVRHERREGRDAVRQQFADLYVELGLDVPAHLTAHVRKDVLS